MVLQVRFDYRFDDSFHSFLRIFESLDSIESFTTFKSTPMNNLGVCENNDDDDRRHPFRRNDDRTNLFEAREGVPSC